MSRSSYKRSQHHLKQLVEKVIEDQFDLRAQGLSFLVDDLEVFGSPPERLKIWATLHFLSIGSPFCCMEPMCHLPLYAHYLDRVNDALRHSMGIQQEVSAEFSLNSDVSHAGVEIDHPLTGRSSSIDLSSIDKRDGLGRTALMRAAVRGYDHLVEELLEAGADPTVVDNQGRGIIEQVRCHTWIIAMIEKALTKWPGTTGK